VPTYQYVCTECATDLEAVQSFQDPPRTECPTCGGRLRKRFGAVGVVFKGSGFYRNDSRKGSAPAESDGGGEKKADKADKGEKAGATASAGASGSSDAGSASGSPSGSSGSGNGSTAAQSGGGSSGSGSSSGGPSTGGSSSSGSKDSPKGAARPSPSAA